MQYKDYYKILGVDRNAEKDEIRKAYRKLARKFHPDVNKSADAEQKYKDINEAYEVLKDPEKRRKYDTLGASWQEGDNFSPPPGPGYGRSTTFEGTDFGGFSDFFRTIFGEAGGFSGMEDMFFGGGTSSRGRRVSKGQDVEAEIQLSLEKMYQGGSTPLTLESREQSPDGRVVPRRRTLKVNIPRGVTDGTRLRLAGKGQPAPGAAPPGDLYLTIRAKKHPRFELRGYDLVAELRITPWEAALGSQVSVRTLDGSVKMNIPAGTQGGQLLRLKGKGLQKKNGSFGDILVRINIAIPKTLSEREKELFEKLGKESAFNPR